MARLSAADARRLGIKITGKQPKSTAKIGSTTKRTGRNRLQVCDTQTNPCEFYLDLPHDPKPKERPRTVSDLSALKSAFIQAKGSLSEFTRLIGKGKSRTYTPKNTLEYERLIAMAAAAAMKSTAPMECAVSVEMTFILAGDPDTWPTSNKDGDVDNMSKAVLDALNGIVFSDDRQVVETICRKVCAEKPGLQVRVSEAKSGN